MKNRKVNFEESSCSYSKVCMGNSVSQMYSLQAMGKFEFTFRECLSNSGFYEIKSSWTPKTRSGLTSVKISWRFWECFMEWTERFNIFIWKVEQKVNAKWLESYSLSKKLLHRQKSNRQVQKHLKMRTTSYKSALKMKSKGLKNPILKQIYLTRECGPLKKHKYTKGQNSKCMKCVNY